MHVLANSPPDTNGYAIRSHMVLKHQSTMDGFNVEAITSPWYPHRDSMVENFERDGIKYHRVLHPARRNKNSKISHKIVKKLTRIKTRVRSHKSEVVSDKNPVKMIFHFCYYGLFKIGRISLIPLRITWKVLEEKILIKHFEESLVSKCKDQNIEIVHAHTPYRVGLPALKAARRLGIPFVYEMRGMWEETAVANGRWRKNGLAHRRFKRMENKVLRSADSVITISETLKHVAISRGVNPEKIVKITNGVEESLIYHKEKSKSFDKIKKQLSSKSGNIVIGYIGSLREMEGVDIAAKAVGELVRSGKDVKFFCLSGLAGQDELLQLCRDENISENSLIAGPVPHNEVPPFYDLIDIFVVSRPDSEVTRKVTPLKPFEAMGRGRAVIVSDLEALTEIVQDKITGLIVDPNNIQNLSSAINQLAEDSDLRDELGNNARNWILQNRLWKDIIQETRESYQYAIDKN